MGNNPAVFPDSTPLLVKAVTLFQLSRKECFEFLKIFNKIDKAKLGKVSLDDIFNYIGHKKNPFSEGLLDLIEINHNGYINYSEFVLLICTYCMFEEVDILKYCFHLFDEEQLGFIQDGDIKSMMNILHGVNPGEKVTGNVKTAWRKMRFNVDDRADFQELLNHHRKFPLVLQPAFKLHRDMQIAFLGVWFWDTKKERMVDFKREQEEASPEGQHRLRKERKEVRRRARAVKKSMGTMRYLCCPCLRWMYYEPDEPDPPAPVPDKSALDKLREEEYRRCKNPDTIAHQQYKRNVEMDPSRIDRKLVAGTKDRKIRAEGRKLRRDKRRDNPLLK